MAALPAKLGLTASGEVNLPDPHGLKIDSASWPVPAGMSRENRHQAWVPARQASGRDVQAGLAMGGFVFLSICRLASVQTDPDNWSTSTIS